MRELKVNFKHTKDKLRGNSLSVPCKIEGDIRLSPQDLGEAFTHLYSDGQVEFFNAVADIAHNTWGGTFLEQMLFVVESPELSESAREILGDIGAALSLVRRHSAEV